MLDNTDLEIRILHLSCSSCLLQTIMCKLTGIQPLVETWRVDTCDLIYDTIIDPAVNLYARPIKQTTQLDDSTLLEFNSYDVVMIDCSTDVDMNIGHEIVTQRHGRYDPNTFHFLDIVMVANSDEDGATTYHSNCSADDESSRIDEKEENWDNDNYVNPKFSFANHKTVNELPSIFNSKSLNFNDMCIDFTEKDLIEMLKLPDTAKFITLDKHGNPIDVQRAIQKSANIQEQTIIEEVTDVDDAAVNGAAVTPNEIVVTLDNMPKLLAPPGRIPKVIWQQSNSLIVLKISAPDVGEYNLNVTTKTLQCW